jgi:hypothetical protein
LKKALIGLVMIWALLGVMTVPALAEFTVSQWQQFGEITTGDTAKGYALVEVTGPLAEQAAADLRDVRVVKTSGGSLEEIPYDIVTSTVQQQERSLSAAVLNRGTAGRDSTAIIDLGSSMMPHNRLRIHTASRNFIKEVTLAGSQNRQTWVEIRNSGKIADFRTTGQVFRQTEISYDSTDFRYLRIALAEGTGDAVVIDGIDVLYIENAPENEKHLPMKITDQETSAKDNSSIITMTGGFSKLTIDKLQFTVEDVNFSRPAVILASSDMKSWVRVGEGTLASFKLTNYTGTQLTLPLTPTSYRYLRVIIENGDSAPVKVLEVKGLYNPRYILFPVEAGGSYRVYVDNNAAQVPKYDLASFSDRVVAADPPIWGLAELQKNPEFKENKVVPASEKHKWLLPGVLAVLVAGLGFFIVRTLPKVMNDGK